ncbi:MAG: Cu2+-exporting ATPase [Chloroflexi bacterium]|jgi:copper chaperone CopZ|nr:MAG: Cu2+-exporting ATPase [Chloroflexota bacterium]
MQQTVVFSVPALHCDGCVETVEHALYGVEGVTSVKGALDSKELRIEFDPEMTLADGLAALLENLGFPPEGLG